MYKHFFKRILDFLLAMIGLILISPPFLVLWVWLTIANKGVGAFFAQERPGKNEKIFRLYKFKSMTNEKDADGNLLPDGERLTKVEGLFVRPPSMSSATVERTERRHELNRTSPVAHLLFTLIQ